jgi:hypothetical protein
MKKQIDELRPEYDVSQLKGCVRGKHAAFCVTTLTVMHPNPR